MDPTTASNGMNNTNTSSSNNQREKDQEKRIENQIPQGRDSEDKTKCKL